MNELGRDLVPRYIPTKLGRDPRIIAPGRTVTGSKSLISLLSTRLTNCAISHDRTRPRSCPKVHPYLLRPRSEKNCTRENRNGIVSTDRQAGRKSCSLTIHPFQLRWAGVWLPVLFQGGEMVWNANAVSKHIQHMKGKGLMRPKNFTR